MKKLLLGSVATGALLAAGSANAADLAVKAPRVAPIYPPVPVFSWTGCFVGAHVGWGWGRHDVTENSVCISGNGVVQPSNSFAATGRVDSSGAIFGGQVGCDYQFAGNWVIGIQGSFSGADINGFNNDPIDATDQSDTLRVKTDFLGSVTGRIGFAGLSPNWLLYFRGGVAWAHERWDLEQADLSFASGTVTKSRTGWTVGAGVEWAFAPNWSAFAEWDHYDFSSKNIATFATSTCPGCQVNTLDAKSRIETVRVGVNYRFNLFGGGIGKGKAPVVAKY